MKTTRAGRGSRCSSVLTILVIGALAACGGEVLSSSHGGGEGGSEGGGSGGVGGSGGGGSGGGGAGGVGGSSGTGGQGGSGGQILDAALLPEVGTPACDDNLECVFCSDDKWHCPGAPEVPQCSPATVDCSPCSQRNALCFRCGVDGMGERFHCTTGGWPTEGGTKSGLFWGKSSSRFTCSER